MKNLAIFDKFACEKPEFRDVTCACIGEDDEIYFAGADGLGILKNASDQEVNFLLPLISADGEAEQPICIEYLPEETCIAIVCQSGNIYTYKTLEDVPLDNVGSVQAGIKAAEWSSDQESLVLVSGTENVLFMRRDFEVLAEVPLHQQEFGEGQFVTVGWGSKQTQFQGSAGKAAAKTVAEKPKTLAAGDDGLPRISWRGDCSLVAISAVDPLAGYRKLRLFNREGTLVYTGEDVVGLEPCLAFNETSLIASSQTLPSGKQQIIFFEPNGLRHGEFPLHQGKNGPIFQVIDIQWNGAYDVLSVVCLHENTYFLQLYSSSNYHWYKKQEYAFSQPVLVYWDHYKNMRLHVFSGNQYHQYNFCWLNCVSRGETADDLAFAYVIDGEKLLCTPFRQTVVPPPMSAHVITLPKSISQVAVGPLVPLPPFDSNSVAVLITSGQLALFTTQPTSSESNGIEITSGGFRANTQHCQVLIELPAELNHSHITSLCWPLGKIILACEAISSQISRIVVLEVSFEAKTLLVKKTIETSRVVNLTPTRDIIFVQHFSGDISCLQLQDLTLKPWDYHGHAVRLPRACPKVEACKVEDSHLLFSLDDVQRCYVNGEELASGITSLALHSQFLLLTTAQHQLHCLRLTNFTSNMTIKPKLDDGREIERGAKLVHCVKEDTKVVLQMPRGNLEAIHPRPLALNIIEKQINELHYGDAFSLMKKQRINLNLLVDHNPAAFMANISTVIQQISKLSDLCLLLTELQPENVTKTMYGSYYGEKNAADLPGKVDQVCSVMREVFMQNSQLYALPIVTTHVKLTKPDVAEALRFIIKLKEQGYDHTEALSYLVVLIDVADLYREALGTYDLQLALLVAQKSQMDPKEYLPFMQDLQQMDSSLRRYKIDLHLKRWEAALESLAPCGAEHWETFLQLTKEHKLYSKALSIYATPGSQRTELMEAYAKFLQNSQAYQEAGLWYQRLAMHKEASECFLKAGSWQNCLANAFQAQLNADELKSFLRLLSNNLVVQKKHVEAAYVLEHHLKSEKEAIQVLIDGHRWEAAYQLIIESSCTEFLESHWNPAVKEAGTVLNDKISQMHQTFDAQVTRLKIVRVNNQQKEEALGNDVDADMYSDVASTRTSMISSQRTGRSSKNSRKLERKKYSLKEGSAYEDLALIASLHDTYLQVEKLKDDVYALTSALVACSQDTQASQLQSTFEKLVAALDASKSTIWNFSVSPTENVFGPNATTESIINRSRDVNQRYNLLEPHIRYPPPMRSDSRWKLRLLA